MNPNEHQYPSYNWLARQRRKLGYSQRVVSVLLGRKSRAALSSYEHGRVLPNLATALRLELILGVPVRFLFPGLCKCLEAEIEQSRRQLPGFGQQVLFEEPLTCEPLCPPS